MGGVFSVVASISLIASVVAVFVLGFRQVFKKIVSYRFIFILWGFVLIRLWIPSGFESSLSIFNFIDFTTPLEMYIGEDSSVIDSIRPGMPFQDNVYSDNTVTNSYNVDSSTINDSEVGISSEESNNTSQKDKVFIEDTLGDADKSILVNTLKVNQRVQILNVLGLVWLIGSIMLFALLIIISFRIKHMMRDKTLLKTIKRLKVYESSKIDSPVIVGLLKPSIVIPSLLELSEQQIEDIINHEKAHIKRLDHINKPIWLITLIVHWFNPIVWFSYFVAMKDMELSCDEKVLKNYDHEKRCHYADTLLSISMHQNNISMNGLVAFGEQNIKTRIKSILKFKGVPLVVKIISPVLILLLFVMLVGQRSKSSEDYEGAENNQIINANTSEEIIETSAGEKNVESSGEIVSAHDYKVGEENQFIEDQLEIIMSSPMESSNPGDYVAAHIVEYNNIVNMEEHAIEYMFSEFEKGNQTGLKGHIMRSLCGDILQGEDIKLDTETGQEWFDELKEYSLHLFQLNGMGFMEENYKYVTLLIDAERDDFYAYDIVNYSDGIVEIDGHQIAYDAVSRDDLLEEITMTQINQMMYRSVLYFKSAFNKDYETLKNLSIEDLATSINYYEGDPRNARDLYRLMNFANYSEETYPFKISSPSKYGNYYVVYLDVFSKNNSGGQMIVTFSKFDLANPIISQVFINKNLEDEVIATNPYSYKIVENFAKNYGFERGVLLSEPDFDIENGYSSDDVKMLIYRTDDGIFGKAELGAGVLTTDFARSFIGLEEIVLDKAFLNNHFSPIKTNFSDDKYVVGILSQVNGDLVNSSIIAMLKDDLEKTITLQLFETSTMATSWIPTNIEYTLTLAGDYILYQDVDLYWKVQHIDSREIYSSELIYRDNSIDENKFEHDTDYYKERHDETYVYLTTSQDNKSLVFNVKSLEFEVID